MFSTILLPYPNFRKSVTCYSDSTLYQTLRLILECRRCLTASSQRLDWRQRDIWCAWSEWEQAYIRLGMMCIEEATSRGISYDQIKAERLLRDKRGKHWVKPPWVNWDRLHSQHRAALLHAGRVEGVGNRIIEWEKLGEAAVDVQVDTVNAWFCDEFSSGIYAGDTGIIDEAHLALTIRNAPTYYSPNHYAQFNWSEQATGRIEAYPPEPEIP